MSPTWVRLLSDANDKADKTSKGIDRSLRINENNESEGFYTLRIPDHAMPETLPSGVRQTPPFWTARFHVQHAGSGNKESLFGPWTGCLPNSHCEFLVTTQNNRVTKILDARALPTTQPQRDILRRHLDTETYTKWCNTYNAEQNRDLARELDRIHRVIDNRRRKKPDPNKPPPPEEKPLTDEEYDVFCSILSVFKMMGGRYLCLGNNPIYHWSNLGSIIGNASCSTIIFLNLQLKKAPALLGFARPLLASARQEGFTVGMFSFPLLRYEVFDKLLDDKVMTQYGENDRKIWQNAYLLFYELIVRIYIEGHPKLPWMPSDGLNLKAINKRGEVLTGACCISMAALQDYNIANLDRILDLLRGLGCILIETNKNNEKMVFVPAMRDAEEMLAETIAIVLERSLKGLLPDFREDAHENLLEAIRLLEAHEDGEDVEAPLNRKQIEAVINIIIHAITILTGAGGTGKTRTSDFVLDKILNLMRTLVCAPTCNAAARVVGTRDLGVAGRTAQYQKVVCGAWMTETDMNERDSAVVEFGVRDETLKSEAVEHDHLTREMFESFEEEYGYHFPMNSSYTLRRKGEGKGEFGHPHPLLLYHTAVVDEAAMASLPLLSFLNHAAKYGVLRRIVLICDPNQLPPIGPGRPLRMLIEKRVRGCAIVNLTENHRSKQQNGSVVKNALTVASGLTQGYVIDKYSRLLFRMHHGVLWIVNQIYRAVNGDLDRMQLMVNRITDATLFSTAFYILFVFLKSKATLSQDAISAARQLQKLGLYLAESGVNPFERGCDRCVEASKDMACADDPKEEVEMLRKVRVFVTIGMRIAYTKNVRSAKISANRQMIVRGFIDLDAEFVKSVLHDPENTMTCEEGGKGLVGARVSANDAPLTHQDDNRDYAQSCFDNYMTYHTYLNHIRDPEKYDNPLVRCMLYTLHMPHNKEGETQLYWVPVASQALRLIGSNMKPVYALTVNGMQGCEEYDVFYACNFPDAIVPGEKSDFFIRRENIYTALSRAKDTITLIVSKAYANTLPKRPSPSSLCLVDSVPSTESVAGADFFGWKGSINRRHPLVSSMLTDFISRTTRYLKSHITNIEDNCVCHRDERFVLHLLEQVCAEKKARRMYIDYVLERARDQAEGRTPMDFNRFLAEHVYKDGLPGEKRPREDEVEVEEPAVSKHCKKE